MLSRTSFIGLLVKLVTARITHTRALVSVIPSNGLLPY